MLSENLITANGITSRLKTDGINLSLFESVTSTNTLLKEMAVNGEGEGQVIIALSQTEGRGRYDRKFQSDKGGIYMSILLRPKADTIDTTLLTAAAAVAVSDAIEDASGKNTEIKWVNDILINGKKVCGILCEGGFMGRDSFVVVGIGINACESENGFYDEIKDIAGTVFDNYYPTLCEKLCAAVIDNLFYQYKHLENREFLNTYRQKSMALGQKIHILKQGQIINEGTALEIDDNCHLKVKLNNDETVTLSSGEVSIKL